MILMTRIPAALALVSLSTATALAQNPGPMAWSIEWKDATIATPATGGGVPITESDLLAPGAGAPGFGPLLVPAIGTTGGELGLPLYTSCIGHPSGTPCGVEVDALSAGRDAYFRSGAAAGLGSPETWFSVDEWSVGQASPPTFAPHASVDTEALVADSPGDVFVALALPSGPAPPMQGPHNVGVLDGNGLASGNGSVYLGLGNVEPNPPTTAGTVDRGDDLDALDIGFFDGFTGGGIPGTGAYFSLDSGFLDPLNGHPNSASASAIGFSGGDVLVTPGAGAPPILYGAADDLGLDLVAGFDSDDVDALILRENGVPGFQPSQVAFDWLPGPGGANSDMLLFSVRRGSSVIGRPDSIFGLPIRPGDILTTPLPQALGGMSQFPGLFMAGENLGLFTDRMGMTEGDDLNALDATEEPCFDCNSNGVEDSADIAAGTSADANKNGIPDDCEGPFISYCSCPMGDAPCGNPDGSAGCTNSTGSGGRLDVQSGTASVGADDLVLSVSSLAPNQFGIIYMGAGVNTMPFGDGLRCVAPGGVGIFRYPAMNSGPAGQSTYGPGIVNFSCTSFMPPGCIDVGETWYFQGWYRDPFGPCGSGFNLTNGLSVQFEF